MALTAACAAQSLVLKSSFCGQRPSVCGHTQVRGARVVALAARNSAVRGAEEKGFFDWLTNTALTKGEALTEKNPLLAKTKDAEKAPAPRGRAPVKPQKDEGTPFKFGFGKK